MSAHIRAVPISEETRNDLKAFAHTVAKAFPVNAGMLRKIAALWDESPDVDADPRDAA